MSDLDLEERLARLEEVKVNIERKRQEIHWAPWQIAAAVITAAATLLAAGVAAGVGLARLFWH